ncbi:chitin deacetylase 8 [Ochlerotatus camptorhynchus]|uniref:chitin deacetylase 8 n=1 Tax=Ochlerotatus camptorhynchus TaxID=644619 RepID=UPI0031D368A6
MISKKIFVCISIFSFIHLILSESKKVSPCNTQNCKPPNCRCSSTGVPGGLQPKDTPQFVLLTFDDAITIFNVPYYREAFVQRVNPDSCPVSATFFVSHEYSDYTLIHEMYSAGHEIALHSISHTTDTDYWRSASVEQLTDEFAGERSIVEKFAKIPASHVTGLRMPFLQMSANNSFQMMKDNNFIYDCSMPTRSFVSPGLWPYTLDYKSTQDCVIGPCPAGSIPGVWVIPMITWTTRDGFPCSMVDTCLGMPNTTQGLFEFFKQNFEKSYLSNKAPFGFYVHAAWFNVSPVHFEAYKKFLDYLKTLKDVFLVNASTVINWVRNPVSLTQMKNSNWSNCRKPGPISCKPVSCELCKKEGDNYVTRWVKLCDVSCPKSYPWLGNHFGAQDYANGCKRRWKW